MKKKQTQHQLIYRSSQEIVNSAKRIIRFHHLYDTVENKQQNTLNQHYTNELIIMIKRCLKAIFIFKIPRKFLAFKR